MNFVRSTIFQGLIAIFALWGALFYSSIESAVAIWYRSETFAHCFLILPICVYLIKQRWAQLNNATIKPSLFPALFVLPVLGIWLFGTLAQALVIEQAATFALLPLFIWMLMGNEVGRILLFTGFFWMFSVPVGEFLIPQLQELTADITVWSLQMTGIPVYREGLYIAIPTGLFEVAVACSGIRYLIASFTLGSLFAYLNYNGVKKRVIFILFSIALPLLANGIRAYGIVIIAHLSDMKYATGVDHLIYGWLFFGVVIAIMFMVGGRWADPLPESVQQVNPNGPKFPVSLYVKPAAILAALVVATLTYKAAFENQVSSAQPELSQLVDIQGQIKEPSWLPIFHNATQELSVTDGDYDYYFAYYNANIQNQELINGRNKLYNIERWSIVTEDRNPLYRTLMIIDNFGNKRLLAYTYVTPWYISYKSMEIKLVQALQALLGQPQAGYLLMVSLPVDGSNEAAMRTKLEEKAQALFTKDLGALLNE